MNDDGVLPFRYLRKPDVMRATGIRSVETLAARVRQGKFPQPDRIDGRALWRSDVVAQWLLQKAAEAEAVREQAAQQARLKGQRMLAARRRNEIEATRRGARKRAGTK